MQIDPESNSEKSAHGQKILITNLWEAFHAARPAAVQSKLTMKEILKSRLIYVSLYRSFSGEDP